MGNVLGGIALLFILLPVLFVAWRWFSMRRGMRRCFDRAMEHLEPIRAALENGKEVTPAQISEVAARNFTWPMLYDMLKHFERLDLYPEPMRDIRAQGMGLLSFWLMHPAECGEPPEEIELVESCPRVVDGEQGEFLVYRYKMAVGHWDGLDWFLGVVGPFVENDVPFSGRATEFARCGDKYGETKPEELVDWFTEMMVGKGCWESVTKGSRI